MARAVTTRRGRDDGIVGTAGSTAAESLLHIVIKEYLILQYCNALFLWTVPQSRVPATMAFVKLTTLSNDFYAASDLRP